MTRILFVTVPSVLEADQHFFEVMEGILTRGHTVSTYNPDPPPLRRGDDDLLHSNDACLDACMSSQSAMTLLLSDERTGMEP